MKEIGIDWRIILKCTYMSSQGTFVVVYISFYRPDTKKFSMSGINKFSSNMFFHLKISKMWL
jgi:hypothetical protein